MKLKNSDLVAYKMNMLWGLLWGAESECEALQEVYMTTKKILYEYLFSFESELSVNSLQLVHKSFASAKIQNNQIINITNMIKVIDLIWTFEILFGTPLIS